MKNKLFLMMFFFVICPKELSKLNHKAYASFREPSKIEKLHRIVENANLDTKLKKLREKLDKQVKTIQEIIKKRDQSVSFFQKILDKLDFFLGNGQRARLEKDLNMYEDQVKVLGNADGLIQYLSDLDYLRIHAQDILKSADNLQTNSDLSTYIKEELDNLHKKQNMWLEKAKNCIKSADDIVFVKYLAGLKKRYSPGGQNICKVLDYAREGDHFIEQIKNGVLTRNSGEIDERRDQIKKIQWALYKKSIVQDSLGFFSGMIQIEAPMCEKLYEFIDSINTGNKLTGSYNRLSTHYKQKRMTSRGLDFRNKMGELDLGALPNGGAHLHYGKLPDGMYIKWEFEGLATLRETLHHALYLAETVGSEGLGSKEHIPSFIKAGFDQIVSNNLVKLSDAEKQQIENDGISGIKAVLEKKSSKVYDIFNKLLKKFDFDKKYGVNRKGNEIILKL